MALLTVVAPLTTIGCGKLELGDHDWTTLTIGDVKLFIAKETHGDIPVDLQQLWWHGYILDKNHLSLKKACVGVNASEVIHENENLTIFLTVQRENDDSASDEDINRFARSRSISFDLDSLKAELAEIGASGKRRIQNCSIM